MDTVPLENAGPPELAEPAPDLDLRAVFDAVPAGFVLLRPDLTVVEANAEFLRLVGRHREDVVGRHGLDVFPASPDLSRTGGNPLTELYGRVAATGRPEAVPLLRYDVAEDGGSGHSERWWSVSVSPLLDDRGSVVLLVGRAEDVTDYVRDCRRHDEAVGADPALGATLYSRLQLGRAAQLAQADASRRVSALADTALRLAAARTLEDVVRIVARLVGRVLGADGAGLAVPTEDGQWQVVPSNGFTEAQRSGWERVPHDSPLPVCHSARTGERVLLPDAAAADAFHPVMATLRTQNGRRAWATLPLQVGGDVLGGLAVAWTADREFPPEDLELLTACAAQCAQSLERITGERTAAEEVRAVRRMAETLQRSLLTRAPLRDGLDVAMHYQPAARAAEVGGDWFDAFETGSGGTVLVVGDVVGHDQVAAAAMGQVRNMVRGIAFDGDDRPATLLARVDQAMVGLELGALATAVLAVVDPPQPGTAMRRLRWANAGHLPPLLRRGDGQVEVLDTSDDLMLGVDEGSPRHEHVVDLAPGDVVVFYTDGLVERRDAHLDDGIDDVREALTGRGGPNAAAWADTLLSTMRATGVEDDTALLVLKLEGPACRGAEPADAAPLEVVLPADPRSVRDARRLTQRCCTHNGLDDDTTDTAVLLTSELVTNAIVHGRSDTRLTVEATPRRVHVEVADDNDRTPVRQPHDDDALSGRGISLLDVAATQWGVAPAGIGKVVWFTLEAS
ncbi:SpoIIE family protein phosphatase [Kineococcus sp. SYSU DK003]|uniref:SpoIIE family protein phosphatase n=1 Tax=Kineococcus sp. SYSU DK003 TaxID=3383124 RepID=UPI003D7C7653